MEQAAVEGIGVYFSSGDNGDESLTQGYITPDWPTSSPWVTSVGGTSLAVGPTNNYEFETAWGTTTSSWKNGAWSPPAPGAWLYGDGGGVSLSSPIIAGIMALADQAAGFHHGFVNPKLYSLSSLDFNDITHSTSTVAAVRENYGNGVDASAGLAYRLRTMD